MKRPRVLLLNLSVSDAAAQVIKWLQSLNHRASINKDSGVSGFFDNLNGCLDIRLYKIMVPIVKTLPSYIKEIQYALEIFFVTLISLAKTNLFSLWILHLLMLSFPMTKVSGPSNIFRSMHY